jgi:hypothetical protein
MEGYRTTLHMWQGVTLNEFSDINNVPVGRRAMSVKTDEAIPEDKLVFKMPEGAKVIK